MVRRGEGAALACSAGYFFCLLLSYYMMRPVRDMLGIRGDLDTLPLLWTGTTLAMLLAAPAFAWLVSRVPRRTFIPLTYRFFALNILLFYGVLRWSPESWSVGAGYAFFIWLSVFNLFAVSVFWGFIADMYTAEQGRRLFGVIAVGGTLGAIAGSAVPAFLAEKIGPLNVLPIAAFVLEGAVQLVRRLVRLFALEGPWLGDARDHPHAGQEPSPRVLAGLWLIARSRYLQGMCVYMLAYTVTSTFLYFEQARIVKESIVDSAARTALFGRIDFATNVLTLLTQVLLTGRIIAILGVGGALAIVPAMTLVGFVALWSAPQIGLPMIGTLVALQVLRRSAHYAIDRPSREILYTPLGPDEKYKSKCFIDTFIYRGGDMIGAWTPSIKGAASVVEWIGVGVSAVWIASAVFLARRHDAMQHPARTADDHAGASSA